MTETTLPLSEFGGSPSPSFKAEDVVGESDLHPLLLVAAKQQKSSTKSLHSSSPSLNLDDDAGSQLRIHRIRAHKRLSAPELLSPGFSGFGSEDDHMPSPPRRRNSNESLGSINSNSKHQIIPDVAPQMKEDEEDDTMHDDEDEDEDDLPPTPSRKLSDSERRFADAKDETIKMPLRKSSAHSRSIPPETKRAKVDADDYDDNDGNASESEVASDSQNQSASSPASSVVTDEAIENMILSQIPEHIRNQMTPEMWKQIFTVNAVSKHTGATSVCSELTDDLASMHNKHIRASMSPPPTQRHSVNHTGMVEDITSPSTSSDFIKENLESHSTFRSFVTDDESKNTAVNIDSSKNIDSAPVSMRSTSSTKDEDTNASTASPETSPIFKRRSLDLSANNSSNNNKSPRTKKAQRDKRSKRPGRRRSHDDRYDGAAAPPRRRSSHDERYGAAPRRRSEEWKEESGDMAPSVPKKKGSIRKSRLGMEIDDVIDSSDSAAPTSGRRLPKKRQYSVRFCPEADIRHHERVLEVHPSTSSGPSVGIGWKYVEGSAKVSWCPSPNKRNSDMLLSRQVRERIVRVELGYTPKQIAKAVRENIKIKNQRRRTVNNLQEYGSFAPVEKVEYTLEKIQRKIAKLGRLGRKSSTTKSSSS